MRLAWGEGNSAFNFSDVILYLYLCAMKSISQRQPGAGNMKTRAKLLPQRHRGRRGCTENLERVELEVAGEWQT